MENQNQKIQNPEEYKQSNIAYMMSPGPNLQSQNPIEALSKKNNFVSIEIQKLQSVPKEYFYNSIKNLNGPYFNDEKIYYRNNQDVYEKIFSNIEDSTLCHSLTNNCFFDAFYLAYALHGEITISPDDVWMAIVLPFANYVDENAERLRDKLVTFDKKKTLIIEIFNNQNPFHTYKDCLKPDFRWDLVFEKFSKLIEQNTLPGIAELIQCNFSSTGQVEMALSQVSLMHAMQKFFDYEMNICGCGIQKVHLLGTLEDWQKLQSKLSLLMKYAPEEWVLQLEKIIIQFINTYQNKPDLNFWNSIMKKEVYTYEKWGPSGITRREVESFKISGWMNVFFSLSKYGYNEKKEIKIEDIPHYYISGVPCKLKCQQTGFEGEIKFGGGFTGVVKNGNNYRPQQSLKIDLGALKEKENNFY